MCNSVEYIVLIYSLFNIIYTLRRLDKEHVKDICILDSGTTHTILKNKKYFTKINLTKGVKNTISDPADLIEWIDNVMFMLSNGTMFVTNDALYSLKSKRNLLSLVDIYRQGYDTETAIECNMKYINITTNILEKKKTLKNYQNFLQDYIICGLIS